MQRRHSLLAAATLPGLAGAATEAWPPAEEITRRMAEVSATEAAFAVTLAARDAAAFRRFLAPDTIFMLGQQALHGPDAVMAGWARFFAGAEPPFSWAPERVLVLPSGELAHSSGPVRNPAGTLIARFQSVWRRRSGSGGWEIVFDQGSEVCR
jgi:ketosteroid isomerase-like protein